MFNPNLQIGEPIKVNSTANITTSYVTHSTVSADDHNAIGIIVEYTKGSETAAIVRVETKATTASIWAQTTNENRTAGTTEMSLEEREFTASGTYDFLVEPMRAQFIRTSIKTNSSSASGTANIYVVPLWV